MNNMYKHMLTLSISLAFSLPPSLSLSLSLRVLPSISLSLSLFLCYMYVLCGASFAALIVGECSASALYTSASATHTCVVFRRTPQDP